MPRRSPSVIDMTDSAGRIMTGGGDREREAFEEHRVHLRAVAYRMLGTLTEAEDAVQEAWLRMDRTDIGDVRNLRGWLTTVVARICLDMLRARSARPEQPLDEAARPIAAPDAVDPEAEAVLADRSGSRCSSSCRPCRRPSGSPSCCTTCSICRTPRSRRWSAVGEHRRPTRRAGATPRARQNSRSTTDWSGQRRLVEAFLAAARDGDFEALLAVLDGDVVLHVDATAAGTADDDPRCAGSCDQCAHVLGQRAVR